MRHHPDLLALAERQHALAARRQMAAMGMSSQAIARVFGSPRFRAETEHVVRLVGAPRTEAQRLLLPILDQGGDAVLSHLAAASWWGQKGCSSRPVVIATTGSSRRTTELAVVHRVRSLPARWTVELDGIPIVRPELLALQLFAVCRTKRASRLVDNLWSKRLLSGPSIEVFLASMGRSGRNGAAGLRQFITVRGPDYVPPATGLESRTMEILAEAGIPMRRQINSGGETWSGRVDFRHESAPMILEVQSERFHSALTDKEEDAERIARLTADGFEVREVKDSDVWARPWHVVQTAESALTALAS